MRRGYSAILYMAMAHQRGSRRSEWKLWVGVIVLLAAFLTVKWWLDRSPTEYQRIQLGQAPPGPKPEIKEATMTPGRVIELDTTKGRIDFVLFEKDCPITASRIAELVQDGCYNGVAFDRVVKDGLIQTAVCKKQVGTIGLEVLEGLINTKGAVGMARRRAPDSATSAFYILLEPWRHLDYEYTVFGRLIRGMDVAFKIKRGHVIKTARVRDLTREDRKLFEKILEIESRRKTD